MDHDFSKVIVTESRDTTAMHEKSAVQNHCQSLTLVPCTLVLHSIYAVGKDWET
jgi:hypothetical protein